MRRGRKAKEQRRESAKRCVEQRNSRTDEQQIGCLNIGNHRALKERARLNKRNPQWAKGKSDDKSR